MLTGLCSLSYILLILIIFRKPDKIGLLYISLPIIECFEHLYGALVAIPLGFITITSSDIAFLLLLFYFLKRGVLKRRIESVYISVIMLLIIGSTIFGLLEFGLVKEWQSDLRCFMKFFVPILYGIECEYDLENLELYETYLHKSMFLFSIFYWIMLPVNVFVLGKGWKFIGSDTSILIACYALYRLHREVTIEKKIGCGTLSYILMVIVQQHNSVWVSFFVGLAYIILFDIGKTIILQRRLFLSTIAIAIIGSVGFIYAAQSFIGEQFVTTIDKFNQINGSAEYGSFSTRMEVWQGCLDSLEGTQWIWGKNFGSGYHVKWLFGIWDTSPHSGYIETIMRLGIIGTVSLLVLCMLLILRLFKIRCHMGVAILLCLMIYWIPYSFTIEQGIIIGILFTYADRHLIKGE